MSSVTLLLGRTRDRRRRALRVEQYAGVDGLGRPNFLFVTDSARKKHTVQEEFVQYRNGASFLPEVATLTELLATLAARYSGGNPPWTESGVSLWLVANPVERSPAWLREAGPTERTSPAVAAAFFAWEAGGRPSLPGERGARLSSLFGSMAASLDAHPAFTTRHTCLRRLIIELGAPGEALTGWLRRSSLVVIDDVVDPAPLDREVLVALAKAWKVAGVNVVISFECGADGVEEEPKYFGVDDGGARLSPTLSATRPFRSACLDALIADGTAHVLVAGPEFGVTSGEVAEERLDPTDVWGTGAPAEARGLSLETWPDPQTEVLGIAHAVRRLLDSGVGAADIWVAFPGLPAYAGLVRRAFGEVGIPHALSRGEPLASQAGARVLMSALRAAGHPDEPRPLLVALMELDLGALPAPKLAAMARRLREQGIRRAPNEQWLPIAAGNDTAGAEVLRTELARLARVWGAPDAEAWGAAISALAEAWGLREGAPQRDDPRRRGAGAALRAATTLTVEARAAQLALDGQALTALWLRSLDGVTLGGRTSLEGAVAVVGMLELRGIHPPHLFIGGLLADDFPGKTSNDWLFDSRGRDALGRAPAMAQARYLLGSALRNSLATTNGGLTLSWPRQREGKLVRASPVLDELLAVQVGAASLKGQVKTRRVPEGRYGEAAWAREAARTPSAPWLPLLRGDLERRSEAFLARTSTSFGAWDGVTNLPHDGSQLAVTAYETYLACPARYLYGSILQLRTEEEFSLDLPAAARGRLLHRVLQHFFRTAMIEGIPSLQATDEETRAHHVALLSAAARAELAADRDVAALPAVQRSLLEEEWCAGLNDAQPAGLLRAWLTAEAEAPPSRVRAVELDVELEVGSLRLRGRADRVDDFAADAQMVLDHKTGGLPTKAVPAGLKVQGVLYGRALATEARPRVVAGFASVRAADDVRRGGWAGPEALLDELRAKTGSRLLTDGEEGQKLGVWLEASARRLAAGHFHPTTASPELAGCGYCPYTSICRVDVARGEHNRASGSADVQAPFADVAPDDEDAE